MILYWTDGQKPIDKTKAELVENLVLATISSYRGFTPVKVEIKYVPFLCFQYS